MVPWYESFTITTKGSLKFVFGAKVIVQGSPGNKQIPSILSSSITGTNLRNGFLTLLIWKIPGRTLAKDLARENEAMR